MYIEEKIERNYICVYIYVSKMERETERMVWILAMATVVGGGGVDGWRLLKS